MMKNRIIIILFILSLLSNIIQFSIIINKNNKIKNLRYTERQVLDIFQVTSELVQDLHKYERDTELGTYYYHAIAKISWILTYMEYNIQYKDANDPLFKFNLSLHRLFGFMIFEQGKESIKNHFFEIIAFLHEIASNHREGKLKKRDQTITEFLEYLDKMPVIDFNDTQQTPHNNHNDDGDSYNKVPAAELPKIIVPNR